MKYLLKSFPEVIGVLAGLADGLLRVAAGMFFDPSEARVYGPLLIGNVHHHNEVRALGLTTMQWFGIGGVLLCLMYAGLRLGEYGAKSANVWFLVARAMLGSIAGILLLNVVESLLTQKVTNYVGWTHAGRFTAINFGDAVVWISSGLLLPVVAIAFTMALLAQGRTR